MNALDRLTTDIREKQDSQQTPIEKLILACRDDTTRLQAAAQWMQLNGRVKYVNPLDMSEIFRKDVPEPKPTKTKKGK